jgi:hypothetical protein
VGRWRLSLHSVLETFCQKCPLVLFHGHCNQSLRDRRAAVQGPARNHKWGAEDSRCTVSLRPSVGIRGRFSGSGHSELSALAKVGSIFAPTGAANPSLLRFWGLKPACVSGTFCALNWQRGAVRVPRCGLRPLNRRGCLVSGLSVLCPLNRFWGLEPVSPWH